MKILIFHNADLRMKCRKGVRGNLRPSPGNRCEQRRFAGIGIADKADFGDDAQLKEEVAFFAWLARLGESRCLARGGGKVAVPQTTAPAFAEHKSLAMLREIRRQFTPGRGFAACRFC